MPAKKRNSRIKREGSKSPRNKPAATEDDLAVGESDRLLEAEAAYADSMVCSALGDSARCVASLQRAIEILPTYAPAILSMGSVEYQRGVRAKGRRLFMSLLTLPDETHDLHEIIDEAGDFLIQSGEYADGLELHRGAAARFPNVPVFHQGVGCCAGHEGLDEEAIAASRRALELEPGNQKCVNDLGWSLFQAGRIDEARVVLQRAVDMDPEDELAAENLRLCMRAASQSQEQRIAK